MFSFVACGGRSTDDDDDNSNSGSETKGGIFSKIKDSDNKDDAEKDDKDFVN